jgi:hypothetical protein
VLLEEAVAAVRRSGLHWLPHAAAGSGSSGGYLLPAAVLAAAAVAVFAVVAAVLAVRRAVARYGPANIFTALAAGVASAVSATGMWVFFATWIPDTVLVRCCTFAFLEFAMLAVALRARDNMRDFGNSGLDGLLVWALTGMSALLSATAATTLPVVLFRLLVPVLAGILWERALVSERRRRKQDGQDSAEPWWRRILVRLGLADPLGRSLSDAEAARRLAAVSLTAHRLGKAMARRPDGWRTAAAERRASAAMEAAVKHTGLATDQRLQQLVLEQTRVLGSVRQLALAAAENPMSWLPVAAGDGEGTGIGTEELAGELAAAQRDGDHARLRQLLADRDDYAGLARLIVTTGGAKRLLSAIALHAGPDQLGSPATAQDWVADVTGQDHYLPDRAEIRRTRKQLFPELEATGGQPAARPLEAA